MSSPQVIVRGVSPGAPARVVEYKRVVTAPPKRLVLSIEGPPKEGKSYFALTAPAPIAVHNLDHGLEGVVSVFPEKEIYEFLYGVPHSAMLPGSEFSAMSDYAQRVWREFVVNFRDSLSKMRTVVVDTGSEAWSLVRLARLGKLTAVLPVQYTAVNAEFRQLCQLALSQDKCNVIFTHKVKDVYKNDQRTGEVERSGFGEIGYDVQAILKTSADHSKKTAAERFAIEIVDSRVNISAAGTRFVGGDCTFAKVAAALYPTADEENWK